jgi:hypothetical protein
MAAITDRKRIQASSAFRNLPLSYASLEFTDYPKAVE